jgi:hypothetical protein
LFFSLFLAAHAFSAETGSKKTQSAIQRLKDTASGFHSLAEKKMILAAAEKDEEKKKALLEASRLFEESAELTEKKIEQEELLEKNPKVLKARKANEKTVAAFEEADKNFKALVAQMQLGEGSKKDSAERGMRFIKLTKERGILEQEFKRTAQNLSDAERDTLHASQKE